MTELTIRDLEAIGKHLKKVTEIQMQNNDSNEELYLDIPERISLDRASNGLPLGHIQYSDERREYVFMPAAEREAPQWTVPLPPKF